MRPRGGCISEQGELRVGIDKCTLRIQQENPGISWKSLEIKPVMISFNIGVPSDRVNGK
jgi:hypothetical protein